MELIFNPNFLFFKQNYRKTKIRKGETDFADFQKDFMGHKYMPKRLCGPSKILETCNPPTYLKYAPLGNTELDIFRLIGEETGEIFHGTNVMTPEIRIIKVARDNFQRKFHGKAKKKILSDMKYQRNFKSNEICNIIIHVVNVNISLGNV